MPRNDKDRDDTVRQIIGRVGKDPERVEWDDREFVSFSVAVTRKYGDRDNDGEGEETRWFNVTVNNEDLMDWVEENIHKGSLVAAQGYASEKQNGEYTNYNFYAHNVSLVEWGGRKTARTTKPAAKSSTKRSRDDW